MALDVYVFHGLWYLKLSHYSCVMRMRKCMIWTQPALAT